ncbi:hypothetical protein F2Q70_00010203 [Brassica cretica]|uniref:Uncharacterized protein n=1 Tax=Brassica cretica TaxID=69181 RepID=A0A8S9LUQ1_BRACR|nr:hypothetical protein F2Q70_00010203 [Brassica cretica]
MSIACRVEAMDESGAGDRSTAAKLQEKLKGEDVKKGETRVAFVGIYGSFEKPPEKEKRYVLPRADGENGENCHVRRLGRRASSAGILQRPNTDQNCAMHDVLPKGFGAPCLP